MTFQDFLEFLFSRLRKGAPPGLGVPEELAPLGDYGRIRGLVERAPVFLLETDPGDPAFIREVGMDVLRDLESALPCPFDNFAIAQETEGGVWRLEWVLRLSKYGTWPEAEGLPAENHFLLWIFTSDRDGPPDFWSAVRFWYLAPPGSVWASRESVDRVAKGLGRSREEAIQGLEAIAFGTTFEIGAISHPANYVVERIPALSPREERRVARGEPRPVGKRPHYIVIDHEGLVELNPKTRIPVGTHRSPAPHARRGHWMRLSERCRYLRAEGKEKVWVRETYVGEREFVDGNSHFRVFLSARDLCAHFSGTGRGREEEEGIQAPFQRDEG